MGVNNQVAPVGIIGGTGLTTLSGLEITGERVVDTPWGEPSSVLVDGLLGDQDCSMTRLAQGLPAGGDLEHADALTVSRAFEGRR